MVRLESNQKERSFTLPKVGAPGPGSLMLKLFNQKTVENIGKQTSSFLKPYVLSCMCFLLG